MFGEWKDLRPDPSRASSITLDNQKVLIGDCTCACTSEIASPLMATNTAQGEVMQ